MNQNPHVIILACREPIDDFKQETFKLNFVDKIDVEDIVKNIFEYIPDLSTASGCLQEYASDLWDVFNDRKKTDADRLCFKGAVILLGSDLQRLLFQLGAYDSRGICPYQFERFLGTDVVLTKMMEPIVIVN